MIIIDNAGTRSVGTGRGIPWSFTEAQWVAAELQLDLAGLMPGYATLYS